MIKIIKDGKLTKFKKTCPDCGCEFEYEASDLIVDHSVCLTTYTPKYNTYVVCPCCGKRVYHGTTQAVDLTNIRISYTNAGIQNTLDCDKCPNKPDPSKITVGDTPCTWCKKRQPYCFNSTANCISANYTMDPKDLETTNSTQKVN